MSSPPKRVAVVTGGGRGIGVGIVRGLAKKFSGDVYLTARDPVKGAKAVADFLEKEGLTVHFHQLDIEDTKSIERLRDFMKEKYVGLDILVNNAGFAFKRDAKEDFGVQAEVTNRINYFSVKQTCKILFPILKPGARVVNMSSSCGWLAKMEGGEPACTALKEKFASSDKTLTTAELDQMVNDFVSAAKAGNHFDKGYPKSAYVLSKVALSALTRIQQREFDEDSDSDLVVNHVHPGYIDTDMSSHKGPKTIDEGARSSIYAALLPPLTDVKGKYIWEDCAQRDWVNGE